MNSPSAVDRRTFLQTGAAVGTVLGQIDPANAADSSKVRVGVIGCGSVSHSYLPHLSKNPHVTLACTCDILPDRARTQANKFNIPHHYPHIDEMLSGTAFDLLVNLTDMQEHEHLNKQALEAGKHVWSEKPLANSLAGGKQLLKIANDKNLRIWGAPAMVVSPQFAFMAKTLAAGKLGRLAAAHASYGHRGPNWSSFFYEKGGGSLPDLGVYNLTTLTGLLGPAQSVTAMTSIVTPTREIQNKGEIRVAAEDNAMVLLEHDRGVISQVQSGFNYFSPRGHFQNEEQRHTLTIVGTDGFMGLVGYDWDPRGVDLATMDQRDLTRFAQDKGNFAWEMGASLAAESLASGSDLLITPQHALHILEIIQAARESQDTGRRIPLTSTFNWPVIS